MDACIDIRLGEKLHAYELDMLSPDEQEEFEMHVLECVHCSARARRFASAAELLRDDPGVRVIVREAEEDSPRSRGRVRGKAIRYLLAAVVILAIGIPVYLIGVRDGEDLITVQTLVLVPVRDATEATLDLSLGGEAEVVFTVHGVMVDSVYTVTIQSRAGDIAYTNDKFAAFDSSGVGYIPLRLESFKPGHYFLIVTDPTGSTLPSEIRYAFRVK